ncbi:papain-like cysteine peptidase [Streptomyces sp. NPDC004111]|uniref:papain-like cysteine peptidase n=1 Tax=Streptomyces sp. NPDC004111 TaxID=3364690 RepID=UPI0036B3AF66
MNQPPPPAGRTGQTNQPDDRTAPHPHLHPHPHPFDTCIGLGYHCESTHQIRRLTRTDRAHFFDWLDLDFASVLSLLDTDFRDVLLPGGTEPFSDGLCAHDRGTGIRFFHEFEPRPGRPLVQADIEAQLPTVRAKFAHLADRWRATTADADRRVLYVHHDAFDELADTDLRRLHRLLARRYPGHRFAVLWLRRTPPGEVAALPPGVVWDTVPEVPGRWQGDDTAWDRVFAALGPRTLWPAAPGHPPAAPGPASTPDFRTEEPA